jgi:hypothetical protein
MKNIPEFLNEGTAKPEEVALVKKLESALVKAFGASTLTKTASDDKTYDYSKGLIHIQNSYRGDSIDWLSKKSAKILTDCGFNLTRYITATISYVEVISNSAPIEANGYIGVSGDRYINNIVRFDLAKPSKVNFDKYVSDFVKKSQKMPICDDILIRLFSAWKPTDSKYKQIGSRDIGIGSAASTHIMKSYNKAYKIKDLDIALGRSKEELENYIKSHYMFKKDRLDFDWKQGVMIVDGQYTEVWD